MKTNKENTIEGFDDVPQVADLKDLRKPCEKCTSRKKKKLERLYCKYCDTINAYGFNSGAAPWTGEISNERATRIKAGFTYLKPMPKSTSGSGNF